MPSASTSARERSAEIDEPVVPVGRLLDLVAAADDVAAGRGDDAFDGAGAGDDQGGLVERAEPVGRMAEVVVAVGPDVEESLVRNRLDHQPDLVGVGDEQEARAPAADFDQQVAGPGAADVFRVAAPALG